MYEFDNLCGAITLGVTIAQLDPPVGDMLGNVEKLVRVLAESRGADAHRGQAAPVAGSSAAAPRCDPALGASTIATVTFANLSLLALYRKEH